MRKKEAPEFFVGDMVRVVDVPYRDCPLSWVDSMDRYCGKIMEIVRKNYNTQRACYAYRIDADKELYMWCGNCFVPMVTTPDSSTRTDGLMKGNQHE